MIPVYIMAYNRFENVVRLLASLDNALVATGSHYLYPVYLFQDGGARCFDVERLSKLFPNWTIKLYKSDVSLGIKGNCKRIFDHILSSKFEYACVLEEDCIVSPAIFSYAHDIKTYSDEQIAQFSFYNFEYNEFAHCGTYIPQINGGTHFLCRLCSSWGFMITQKQVRDFYSYGGFNQEKLLYLPAAIAKWPDTSWKKFFINYILGANKFVLVPRFSLCSTQASLGANTKKRTSYATSNIFLGQKYDINISGLSKMVQLDEYLEIENPEILFRSETAKMYISNISFNIYGQKNGEVDKLLLQPGQYRLASDNLEIDYFIHYLSAYLGITLNISDVRSSKFKRQVNALKITMRNNSLKRTIFGALAKLI